MYKLAVIDYTDVGIIQVKYDGIVFAEVFYRKKGEDYKYLTKDSAIKMAKEFARSLLTYEAIPTTKGIGLLPKHIAIHEE
jgi:hypothetical protein